MSPPATFSATGVHRIIPRLPLGNRSLGSRSRVKKTTTVPIPSHKASKELRISHQYRDVWRSVGLRSCVSPRAATADTRTTAWRGESGCYARRVLHGKIFRNIISWTLSCWAQGGSALALHSELSTPSHPPSAYLGLRQESRRGHKPPSFLRRHRAVGVGHGGEKEVHQSEGL